MYYFTTLILGWCYQTRKQDSPHWMASPFTTSLVFPPLAKYSVMDDASYAKVNPKAPLDKICLLGSYGIAIGERNL